MLEYYIGNFVGVTFLRALCLITCVRMDKVCNWHRPNAKHETKGLHGTMVHGLLGLDRAPVESLH